MEYLLVFEYPDLAKPLSAFTRYNIHSLRVGLRNGGILKTY